jgi:insertion element IS1 protein InsB
MNNLHCPQCGLSHIKRNGYTHFGKQNYRCKDCDRQFVEDSQRIGEEVKDLIKVLLLERLSLRGICRVTRRKSSRQDSSPRSKRPVTRREW